MQHWSVSAGIEIRQATAADRGIVMYFHRALYVRHRTDVVPAEIDVLSAYADLGSAMEDDVSALLSSPVAVVLIGEKEGVPVGYVTGHVESDPRRVIRRRGIVEDWYVDP